MRNVVIISRKWDHPRISMVVTDEELSFMIDLSDFMSAIKYEMAMDNGNGARIDAAVESVVRAIKGESIRVMG